MKRRFTTLAAMLLLMGALMVGILGTASAQDAGHEADGAWHTEGHVSFKITWKGVVHVRWQDWLTVIETTTDDMGEVVDAQEKVSVDRWEVTATHATEDTKTKSTDGAPRQVIFGKPDRLKFGETYTVAVKGFDEDGDELGSQQVTVRPSHVSAPNPVTGLTLSVGADKLSVNANWTAPAAGGMPKRYEVWLTNLDTGRARWKLIKVKQGSGGEFTMKTDTAFDQLWPRERYRVSVQTLNHNSRWQKAAGVTNKWQGSDWTHKTVTMPAGDDPSYEKKTPTLIWKLVRAGEKTPPYVIGEPTAYIVMDASAAGGRAKFDAPNECLNYKETHGFFLDEDSDAEARKAILKAESQHRHFVVPARAALNKAEAAKQEYLDGTPEADRSEARIAELDLDIARKQREVDATEQNLAVLVAKLETECARAYPAEENLTEADDRWYQVAQRAPTQTETTEPETTED